MTSELIYMTELIVWFYPWLKAGHVFSVIAWMAGLFYLPRLFVYHSEEVNKGSKGDELFIKMEKKLLNIIMFPAMISSWIFGLFLYSIPGLIDWTLLWSWIKLFSVIFMTVFHLWLFTFFTTNIYSRTKFIIFFYYACFIIFLRAKNKSIKI